MHQTHLCGRWVWRCRRRRCCSCNRAFRQRTGSVAFDQPNRSLVIGFDHLFVHAFHDQTERGVGLFISDIGGNHDTVPPQGGGRCATFHGQRCGSHFDFADNRAFGWIIHGTATAGPQIGHRNLALLELLLHVCGVADQHFRIGVLERLGHCLKCLETRVGVHSWRVVGVKERAAKAGVHVDEFLREVPTGFHRGTDRMIDHAGLFDRCGGSEHFVPGGRNIETQIAKDILAVHQVLCVDHHSNRHGLAIYFDQLIGRQVLTILGDQIIQRSDCASVQQRSDCAVGHATDLIERWVRLKGGRLLCAEFLIQLGLKITALRHGVCDSFPCFKTRAQRFQRHGIFIGARGESRGAHKRDSARQCQFLQIHMQTPCCVVASVHLASLHRHELA